MTSADLHQRNATENLALGAMTKDGVAEQTKTMPMDTYNLFYTTSRLNGTLHRGDSDTPAEYYLQLKLMTIRKPQLYLRKGDAKSSPTIGVCKFQWTSRHTLIAHGDYEKHEEATNWNELHRDKNGLRRSDYSISIGEKDGIQSPINLLWRKDRSKAVATVYDCVDDNGTVVAKLRSGGGLNWKKGGEFEIASSLGETVKEWLLLSALGLWTWEAFDYQSLRQGYDEKDEKAQKIQ